MNHLQHRIKKNEVDCSRAEAQLSCWKKKTKNMMMRKKNKSMSCWIPYPDWLDWLSFCHAHVWLQRAFWPQRVPALPAALLCWTRRLVLCPARGPSATKTPRQLWCWPAPVCWANALAADPGPDGTDAPPPGVGGKVGEWPLALLPQLRSDLPS